MMTTMVLFATLAIASVTHASSDAEVSACVDRLGSAQTSLNRDQIELLINARLGDGPYPAELRREYSRDQEKLVTLSFKVDARGRALAVQVRADGITDEVLEGFFKILRADFKLRVNCLVNLTPHTEDPKAPRVRISRVCRASTGHRHPLEPTEAFQMFRTLDEILTYRLIDHTFRDFVSYQPVSKPDVKF